MIKLYEGQKHTIYEIQKFCRCSINTLYHYARGTHKIENMPIKLILDIAYFENIEVNKLYEEMKKYHNEEIPNYLKKISKKGLN